MPDLHRAALLSLPSQGTWQLQWPAINPKRLAPRFVALSEAEAAIGKGSGNPDFRIARTAEDGEEEAAAADGGSAAAQDAPAVDKRLVERRRCASVETVMIV